MKTPGQITQRLAEQFIERVDALGYKGKRRDDAALDFFCGAASAAEALDPGLTAHLTRVVVHLIAIRGYMAVLALAHPEPASGTPVNLDPSVRERFRLI
jgi:folate-dependent phosphoribosylglycinamide formyltransferase PurN